MKIMDSDQEAAHESETETAPLHIVSFSSKAALPDTASLQIKLIFGEQTLTVPLELKDVPLP